MSAREFYILEVSTAGRTDTCLWWCVDDAGYTTDLDRAGLYTEADARAIDGVAVHRDDARAAVVPTVAIDRLRATGARAIAEFDLRAAVDDAWRGRPHDLAEAASALGWSNYALEAEWHGTDIHRLAEWRRVAETVTDAEPGDHAVDWPTVEVSLESTDRHPSRGRPEDRTVARAMIGRVRLTSEVGVDRETASRKLIEAARVRGRMERGEP